METAEGRSPGAGDTGLDHVTVVVRDLERAVALFDRLGLEETTRVVVAGKTMARYMDIPVGRRTTSPWCTGRLRSATAG